MSQLGPAKEPFKIVWIGTFGGFGLRSTKKYLHLLVDHFTRFGYIITSKTQNSNDFIRLTQNPLLTALAECFLKEKSITLNFFYYKKFFNKKIDYIVFLKFKL